MSGLDLHKSCLSGGGGIRAKSSHGMEDTGRPTPRPKRLSETRRITSEPRKKKKKKKKKKKITHTRCRREAGGWKRTVWCPSPGPGTLG